jgi:phosphatidylglycerophosphate synthase
MRSADIITLFRTFLIFPVAYMILAKWNAVLVVALILIIMLLDSADGYAALHDVSKGEITLSDYLKSVVGNKEALKKVSKFKGDLKKSSRFGARIDIAGDRVVEYVLWIVFVFVSIVPLFVLFLILIRHSFVDALMGKKGTSSEMRNRVAGFIYSSPIGRGGINVVKGITFSYLALVYILGWPLIIGQIFVAILVAYILLRGAAEIYESINTREK